MTKKLMALASALFFTTYLCLFSSYSVPLIPASGTDDSKKNICINIIEEASRLRDQKEYTQALMVLDSAQKCLSPTQPDYLYNTAHLFQIRSHILMSLTKIDSAKLVSYEAINLIEENDHDSLLSKLYNGLGNCFWYNNSFDSALKYYSLALKTSLNYNQGFNLESSSYYQNIGLVNIYKGDYEQAEEYLLKSIDVKKNILGENDPSLARNYLNLGVLYTSMSKLDNAFEYYSLAENLYLQNLEKYSYELGNLYWNKGNGYITVGDYENAEYYLNNALAKFQEHYSSSSENVSSVLMNLGFVYEKTGRSEDAIQFYNKALSDNISPSRIKTLRNLALLYAKRGDFITAEEYFKRSISDATELFGNYSQDLGLSYLYYGEALASAEYHNEGLAYFERALDIFYEIFGHYNRDVSTTLLRIGDYYLAKEEFQTALSYYQKSIFSIVRDTINEEGHLLNPIKEFIPSDLIALEALSKKAKALYLMGSKSSSIQNLRFSLETYDIVSELIDQLKNMYSTEESKLILSNKAKEAYNNMISVSIDLFGRTADSAYLSKAFNLSERSKSSVLLASLNEVDAKIKGQIPEKLLDKERNIKENLGTYNRLLYEENQKRKPSQDKLNLWRSKVFELKTKHDSLINFFEKEYPSYYDLKYEKAYVNIKDIQKSLSQDIAVVDYIMMDTMYYAFLIDRNSVTLFRKNIDSSLLNNSLMNIIASSRQFAPVNFDTADYRNFVMSSHSLYKMLFKDIENELNYKRLLIIPDGSLNYLPFDLLSQNSNANYSKIDFKNADFLIKKYALSYSSSATLFIKSIYTTYSNGSRVLAIAPSYEDYNSNTHINADTLRASLLPLHYTKFEIEKILSTFPGKSYLDEKATEKVFFQKASSFDIIHLAMHTIINDADPMYSKLVFYSDTTESFDGYLNTYEIYNMKLHAQLAVLSACNTGYGKLEKGEGVMNMARAFMFAGVPGVVMTLWTVEDKSGAQIVDKFYQNLSMGMSRDIALQNSKIEYLENASDLFSHPYYWAAYVNMGSNEPINTTTNISRLILVFGIAIGLFFVFLVFFIILRRRKRNTLSTG